MSSTSQCHPLHFERKPAASGSFLEDKDWFIWCTSVVEATDGTFYAVVSRWPKKHGFESWVMHSELALAQSDSPVGPFHIIRPLWEKQPGDWDQVAHNPSLHYLSGKYFLYYMATHASPGKEGWWDYRNQQRIGVAQADHPSGPWRRSPQPYIDVTPGSWDDLACSNPTCAQGQDGRYYMIYKGIGSDGPMPCGGSVKLGLAIAESPEGPFIKEPKPILENPTEKWAFEDPYLWNQCGRFYLLAKDFFGLHTGGKKGLFALFTSDNAIDWIPTSACPAFELEIPLENGSTSKVHRLERPSILFRNGKPRALYLACYPELDGDRSFNVSCHVRIG